MPYRAPELFDVRTGITLDEKVDIWVSCCSEGERSLKRQSLGCTLYAMLYGHSPFEVDGSSIAMAVGSGRYSHPSNASKPLAALIDQMLVVDPSQRPDIEEVCTVTAWVYVTDAKLQVIALANKAMKEVRST